jgi:hypothetical protein
MAMFKESDVLDPVFRKKVIKEIQSNENQQRKLEHFKRYEVYHDRVAKYTEDLMAKQFDATTIDEMKMSLTNISLCRKIVDKLARVYSNGVERQIKSKRDMKSLEVVEKHLCVNAKMKKANRYLELHNNVWMTCLPKPKKDRDGNVLYYDLKLAVLPPFLFDVIEDQDDREKAQCLILSNFNPENAAIMYDAPERNGKRGLDRSGTNSFQRGDGVDQTIADTPNDFDPRNQRYIFWTDSYHMTCDGNGAVVSAPEGMLNPIQMIPGIALNKDQDGEYYSIGGSDLVDSCLLINSMMTNINHIGVQQGYGQAWMSGNNLPQKIQLGPTKVIKLETPPGGERPDFGFATSNPPLDQLKQLTTTQIALLLSTNNLSTSGVKVDLSSGVDFPSGIAMMIDKAESTEDVKDQAQIFLDNEKHLWEIAIAWIDAYEDSGMLIEDLKGLSFSLDEFHLKINEPHPIASESEKLENLKKRMELGINTKVDLIKIDDPQLTDEQAAAKLEAIMAEKEADMARFVDNNTEPEDEENPDEETLEEDDEE